MNLESISAVIFFIFCLHYCKCEEERQEMSVDGANIMTPSNLSDTFVSNLIQT